MLAIVRWCSCLVGVLAMGCSPALNWREARFAAAPARLLLPCKPDKATRDVDMGGQVLSLEMQGCVASGITFAVSHIVVQDAARVAPLLEGWKRAVLAHLGATEVREMPWAPSGGWTLPQSVRLQGRASRGGGEPMALSAAWFARIDGSGVHLFHAIVLAPTLESEATETFFAGMAMP